MLVASALGRLAQIQGNPTFAGPEPEYSFIRSVPVGTLRRLVLDAVASGGGEPQNNQMRTRPAQASEPRR